MPFDPFDHDFERGLRNRRRILGDDWVDQSLAHTNELNAAFQNFFTRYAWHEVWGRPGMDAPTRRLIVLAVTAALGRWEEFEMHTRAALYQGDADTRLTVTEVREALIQLAVYAGVPAANTAFGHVQKILREAQQSPAPQAAADAAHPGVGRPMRTRSTPAIFATVREPRNGLTPRHTVVCSHALGCDGSMWDDLANELAQEHRVICFDHRGHGRSDAPPGPYTLAELAEDAARLLDELATGPVVFIGLSMGGMVAQELALRHPEKVRALVIANSSSGYDEAGRTAWQQRIATLESGGLAAVVEGAQGLLAHVLLVGLQVDDDLRQVARDAQAGRDDQERQDQQEPPDAVDGVQADLVEHLGPERTELVDVVVVRLVLLDDRADHRGDADDRQQRDREAHRRHQLDGVAQQPRSGVDFDTGRGQAHGWGLSGRKKTRGRYWTGLVAWGSANIQRRPAR